ncbi:hypothetical protein QMK33_14900 [Hymenobacter sp. H14-R3]|uniref:hypothetical protein n=1 Tax=Hymenobacter sp. H14-R3 TaxID=3046308 RepID=UPI0024B97F2B|nr:hypothetical protein [Hymenobacter sp. H14-R3]MDJ0366445.1 hypothetical protein [Hymenobacter sp. H14-R3]
MNRLIVISVALVLLLSGAAQAQRGYYGRPGRVIVAPRPPVYRQPYYGPRYYHAAPYRSYRGRSYYRPRPQYGRPVYRGRHGRRGRRH